MNVVNIWKLHIVYAQHKLVINFEETASIQDRKGMANQEVDLLRDVVIFLSIRSGIF